MATWYAQGPCKSNRSLCRIDWSKSCFIKLVESCLTSLNSESGAVRDTAATETVVEALDGLQHQGLVSQAGY